MCVITKHFDKGNKAITLDELTEKYDFPPRIAIDIIEKLIDARLIVKVINDDAENEPGLQPALNINRLSVAHVLSVLKNNGETGFVPNFNENFNNINITIDNLERLISTDAQSILIKDLEIKIIE